MSGRDVKENDRPSVRRIRRMRRVGPLALAVFAIILVAAACHSADQASPGVAAPTSPTTPVTGASSTSGDSTVGGSALAQALKYADCMRSHGIADFPDPNDQGEFAIDADGPSSDLNSTNPTFQGAELACKSLAPSGGTAAQQQQNYDAELKYAHCMRSHGQNLPDPKAPGSGPNSQNNSGGSQSDSNGGTNPNSPQFITANKACEHYLPAGSGPSLSGGGPSGS
jgi:hypothetical protein